MHTIKKYLKNLGKFVILLIAQNLIFKEVRPETALYLHFILTLMLLYLSQI